MHFYSIPSSEFNAYLKQIKVLLSTVKKYRIFFTSEENDLYFFTATDRGYFDNSGLLSLYFFQKRSGIHRSYLAFATDVRTSSKATDGTLWRHF